MTEPPAASSRFRPIQAGLDAELVRGFAEDRLELKSANQD